MNDYKLYNEDQKNRFLKTLKAEYPQYYWERVFDKSYDREVKYNRDICNFSTPELIEYFKLLDSKSYDTLNVLKLNLVKYIQWCLSNMLVEDGQNHALELTEEILRSCINKVGTENTIVNKEEFVQLLNEFQNFRDKFVLCCLFEGIQGRGCDEVLNLKIEDIDVDKKIAKLCTGREVPVSSMFISVSQQANDENMYITTAERKYLLKDDGYIYKEILRNTPQNRNNKNQYNQILRTLYRNGANVTPKNIINSGLIDMINKLAKENNCTAAEVLYNPELFEKIYVKYKLPSPIRRKFLIRFEEYFK